MNKSKFWNEKRYTWLALFLIFVAALAAYSNSFDVPFLFDDENNIIRNKSITHFGTFEKLSYWTDVNNRPLSFFTFALNYAAGGLEVKGYHIINFLIHVLSGFLAYLLAKLLFRLTAGKPEKAGVDIHWKALLVGLLFVLHPIQTMGTTYIVQRMTSMAALFFLLSVVLYIRARRQMIHHSNNKKGIRLLIFALFAGLLGVLSKQNAATFPLAFLFVELFFIRNPEDKPYKKYIATGFSIMLLALIGISALGMLPREVTEISRFHYLLTQCSVLLDYLRLLFLPYGLNIDHGIAVSTSIGLRELGGALVYVGLITAAWLLYKRDKIISFGIVWFGITMFIESGIIPIRDVMMEHRMYLPLFGFALALVGTLKYIPSVPLKKYAIPAIVVVLLVFTYATHARNNTWRSWLTIWENSLEQNPANPRAMTNLGYGYALQKDYKKAINYYNSAIKVDSSFYSAYLNRGIAYFDQKMYKPALKDFSVYLAKYKKREAPYFMRGLCHTHLGNFPEAISNFTEAIKINPETANTYQYRGIAYLVSGRGVEALRDFNRALEIDPSNKMLLVNRAKAHHLCGEYDKAMQDVEQAQFYGLSIDPKFIEDLKKRI